MAKSFWFVECGLLDAHVNNEFIRDHLKCRYANSLDMVSSAHLKRVTSKARIDSNTVRVELLPSGCYDILSLDTIWGKGYKGEYKNFEELPDEIKGKVAVLNMMESSSTIDGRIEGVGRKVTQNICWVYLDNT